jgi:hypothetical protein
MVLNATFSYLFMIRPNRQFSTVSYTIEEVLNYISCKIAYSPTIILKLNWRMQILVACEMQTIYVISVAQVSNLATSTLPNPFYHSFLPNASYLSTLCTFVVN